MGTSFTFGSWIEKEICLDKIIFIFFPTRNQHREFIDSLQMNGGSCAS